MHLLILGGGRLVRAATPSAEREARRLADRAAASTSTPSTPSAPPTTPTEGPR